MSNYLTLIYLVARYNHLLTRFGMRLTKGNTSLVNQIVKEALEEAYEENKLYDTPELRILLKNKVVAKAKASANNFHLH